MVLLSDGLARPGLPYPRNEVYLRKMRGHLRELLGGYGRIDLVWFDYDGGPTVDQENTYALVRGLQPGVIIDDRLSLGPVKNNDPCISIRGRITGPRSRGSAHSTSGSRGKPA